MSCSVTSIKYYPWPPTEKKAEPRAFPRLPLPAEMLGVRSPESDHRESQNGLDAPHPNMAKARQVDHSCDGFVLKVLSI